MGRDRDTQRERESQRDTNRGKDRNTEKQSQKEESNASRFKSRRILFLVEVRENRKVNSHKLRSTIRNVRHILFLL